MLSRKVLNLSSLRMFISQSIVWLCAAVFIIDAHPSTINKDKCDNYCFNDGVCVLNDGQVQCYCLPEWQGQRCQSIRQDDVLRTIDNEAMVRVAARSPECLRAPPNMCLNGGLCTFENSSYSCACPVTHIGKRCQDPSRTSLSSSLILDSSQRISLACVGYCHNGGLCTLDANNDQHCNCNGTGFEGVQCQRQVTTTTLAPNTTTDAGCAAFDDFCKPGTCLSAQSGNFLCQCPAGFQPPYCDPIPAGRLMFLSRSFHFIVDERDLCSRRIHSWTKYAADCQSDEQSQSNSNSYVQSHRHSEYETTWEITTGCSARWDWKGCFHLAGVTCAEAPCRNNRPCYDTGNTFFCYCGPQFAGDFCEQALAWFTTRRSKKEDFFFRIKSLNRHRSIPPDDLVRLQICTEKDKEWVRGVQRRKGPLELLIFSQFEEDWRKDLVLFFTKICQIKNTRKFDRMRICKIKRWTAQRSYKYPLGNHRCVAYRKRDDVHSIVCDRCGAFCTRRRFSIGRSMLELLCQWCCLSRGRQWSALLLFTGMARTTLWAETITIFRSVKRIFDQTDQHSKHSV